jgi:multidrug efflux pump subunit AcrB
MDSALKEVPQQGLAADWIGLAKEQIAAGSLGALVFLFGIIMVFLTLSAQYESYVDPIIILLTVPLAMLGALSFIAVRGLNNDVYVQVALVMLIGLASKNAILIVEFANQSRADGVHHGAICSASGRRTLPTNFDDRHFVPGGLLPPGDRHGGRVSFALGHWDRACLGAYWWPRCSAF